MNFLNYFKKFPGQNIEIKSKINENVPA